MDRICFAMELLRRRENWPSVDWLRGFANDGFAGSSSIGED
jgi:hypothetical protein